MQARKPDFLSTDEMIHLSFVLEAFCDAIANAV